MLYDGDMIVYFDKNDSIYLSVKGKNKLLKILREWIKCYKCSNDNHENHNEYILLNENCCICKTSLEPRHENCYENCPIIHMLNFNDNKICDDCADSFDGYGYINIHLFIAFIVNFIKRFYYRLPHMDSIINGENLKQFIIGVLAVF